MVVLYNVKSIGGGIHVIDAFIRSLMVGGGAQKHFFDRNAHPGEIFKYPKMTQNSSQNKSNFWVERTIYA